ncbi:N5-carboxyaminoimidazole ribonucleotide mutase [Clostridia bacterium]|nr:N5-carboxyaminoimidazole ribonucleotide mutase [Clostridia bacterium]
MSASEPLVGIVMGSDSDLPIVAKAAEVLKKFGVSYSMNIISAHRSPNKAHDFASNADKNGMKVLICAAGKAAHLAGVMAAYTVLPVIGLPTKSSTLDGLDSLLSVVQMPNGIPVATVAIDGAVNAALLAIQILAVGDSELKEQLIQYKADMAEEVEIKDAKLKKEFDNE